MLSPRRVLPGEKQLRVQVDRDPLSHAKEVVPHAVRRASIGSDASAMSKHARRSTVQYSRREASLRKRGCLWRFFIDARRTWRKLPGSTRDNLATSIALFYLFVTPYQIGFESDARFNALYVCCYCLDFVLIFLIVSKRRLANNKGEQARLSKFMSERGSERASMRDSFKKIAEQPLLRRIILILLRLPKVIRRGGANAPLVVLQLLPFDAVFWLTDVPELVPFFRLSRYGYALVVAHRSLVSLEQSQVVPFGMCRLIRMMSFTTVFMHGLACYFFYLTTRPGAQHFSNAPWLSADEGSTSTSSRYLRSMYWSFISFTTTGHKNIVAVKISDPGKDWEVGVAIVVALVGTFAYIYLNANFTTMVIRLNSRLEQYRAQLAGIDAYLARNKVSKEVGKRVKKHFARRGAASVSADKALLSRLPTSLQKDVLQDIHLRTLKNAPTFVGVDPEALRQVCAVVRAVTYLGEEILAQQGDVVTEMYFLEEGCVLITTICDDDDDEYPESPSHEGSCRQSPKLMCSAVEPFVKEASLSVAWALKKTTKEPSDSSACSEKAHEVAAQGRSTDDIINGHHSEHEKMRMRRSSSVSSAAGPRRKEKTVRRRGSPLCEVGFLFGLRQEATLEAVTTTTCCVLQKGDFHDLKKEFPDIVEQAKTSALARLRHNKDHLLEQVEAAQMLHTEKQLGKVGDLLCAAAAGNLEVVQEAFEQDPGSIAVPDYEGRTALHLAISSGRLEVVQFLVARKGLINRTDSYGRTPLSDAVHKASAAIVKIVRDAGGQLGWSELETAGELCDRTREGHTTQLKLLLSCGANVNAADYDNRTCFHLAASEGNFRVCELLLEHEANVNAIDRWGGTPLRDAIREGHYHVARALFKAGGKLLFDEVTASGELCELARRGLTERLQLLLECGCEVNAADYDKRTCLHLAASVGNKPIVERLVMMKANVNAADRWGGTPLSDAVKYGHHEVAKALSGFGAVLNQAEVVVSGELCELARQGSLDKLKVLLSCGVNINACDYDKRTCLHLAASEGNLHVVELLLEFKADVNFEDRWGGTPMSDAVSNGHKMVITALRKHGGLFFRKETQLGKLLGDHARQGEIENLKIIAHAGVNISATDRDRRSALHIAAAEGQKGAVQTLLALGCDKTLKDRHGRTAKDNAELLGNTFLLPYLT